MIDPPSPGARVHVIGAAGRSGAAIVRALRAAGLTPVPVVRNAARWAATGLPERPLIADLTDPPSLQASLAGATCVVSAAHARHTEAILAAAPDAARLVLMGSTRKFTRWPDAHGLGVLHGERALLGSGRPGVMLHPTMIYGAEGEDNVQRLARWLRRLPVVPLPGGGRSLVQPIHQSDVTRAILAALGLAEAAPFSLVIAGPTALPYADFVRAVAHAARLSPPRILKLPAGALIAAAALTRFAPGLPRIRVSEVRRLTEDKAFDIAPMRQTLGIDPIPLQEGLGRTMGFEPTTSKTTTWRSTN